jgi:orotate phosphoribosyltransferase-like protein
LGVETFKVSQLSDQYVEWEGLSKSGDGFAEISDILIDGDAVKADVYF